MLRTINTEIDCPESPATTPMDADALQPGLTKGMSFHNGFLYKLGPGSPRRSELSGAGCQGDGLLNSSWNLRYFLLIGVSCLRTRLKVSWPGQTLQYYRSQHEARPRDAINLSPLTG